MTTTHIQRFNNAKIQEKIVSEHFANFIKSDANIKKLISSDLTKSDNDNKFSEEDFNRTVITYSNDKNVYGVDLGGYIDSQPIFQTEVKTIMFDETHKNKCKRPIIPITLEAGKYAIEPSKKFAENGLVAFYNESKINKVPLYIIVFDEHAYLSGKKSKDYFYFYNAKTTAKFIDIINLFFGIVRSHPEYSDSNQIIHSDIVEYAMEEATKILCKPRGIPIPAKNSWEGLFKKWPNSGAISFFPENCKIFPDLTFS